MSTVSVKECQKCHSKTRNPVAEFCWKCGKPYDQKNQKQNLNYLKGRFFKCLEKFFSLS
jgi:predicted amidophosphoribosyltransferase